MVAHTLVLPAGHGSLRLQLARDDWCRVTWEADGVATVLGADTGVRLRDRLVQLVHGFVSLNGSPTWVTSLSEAHGSLYAERDGDSLKLHLQDAAANTIARALVPPEQRREWDSRLQSWRPRGTFRLDPGVIEPRFLTPPHRVHDLRRHVPLALAEPDIVFMGLRRHGRLEGGFAFCKRIRQMHGNDGSTKGIRGLITYCVFADADGVVFDWGWVRASRQDRRRPVNWRQRFAREAYGRPSVSLEVESDLRESVFAGPTTWHSPHGDCIVSLFQPVPYYAERVSDDFTVLLSWPWHEPVGVKVKNIDQHISSIRAQLPPTRRGDPIRVDIQMVIEAVHPEALATGRWEAQRLLRHRDHTTAVPPAQVELARATA